MDSHNSFGIRNTINNSIPSDQENATGHIELQNKTVQ